jgi:hypothetical protein
MLKEFGEIKVAVTEILHMDNNKILMRAWKWRCWVNDHGRDDEELIQTREGKEETDVRGVHRGRED